MSTDETMLEGAHQPPRLSLIERAANRLPQRPASQLTTDSETRESGRGSPGTTLAPTDGDREIPRAEIATPHRGKWITLDYEGLARVGQLTPHVGRSLSAEEYRSIKRPLLQFMGANADKPELRSNLLMVTSAIPGEGKTFTSINLAMSITKERDINVLLVDADLTRPTLTGRLGIKPERGFVDLLEDETLDVPDILLKTDIPNLSIVPCGRPHTLGTELLASKRASQVISEFASRYKNRMVIFDTAPVLASNEVGALSHLMGQIVLVVEAERTTAVEVTGALNALGSSTNVQIILNKARTRFGNRFNYYKGYY